MTEVVTSWLVCFIIGLAALFFPRPTKLLFCRIGRTIWRIVTFGLTDMRWFYREDGGHTLFRVFGALCAATSAAILTFSITSISKPTSFGAVLQARRHLERIYGKTSRYRFNAQRSENTIDPKTPMTGYCLVHYDYDGRKGTLKGIWTTNQCFEFHEFTRNTAQPPGRPNR